MSCIVTVSTFHCPMSYSFHVPTISQHPLERQQHPRTTTGRVPAIGSTPNVRMRHHVERRMLFKSQRLDDLAVVDQDDLGARL